MASEMEMMDFEVQIAHSVTEIGQAAWDHLSAGRPFSSYRWYRFGETVLSDCPPTHIILSQNSQAVARASFWLKRREWLPFSSSVFLYGVELLLQKWPLFMCAAPLASAPALILTESPLRESALRKIAELAFELGREQKVSLTFFGYTNASVAQEKAWPERYSPVSLSNTDTCLEIVWANFDSYIKSLSSKTRSNFRRHRNRAVEMGVVTSIQKDTTDLEQTIALIRGVESRHRMSHRPWTRSMLENLHTVDSTWITAHIGQRLVGCGILVGDGDSWSTALLGLEYSIPNSIFIYHQLMYTAIRFAIESKAKILYGGDGAYELKQALGFRRLPEDYMLVASSNGILRWLIRSMTRQARTRPQEPVDTTG